MKVQYPSWKYYLKRIFCKPSTWLILFINLIMVIFALYAVKKNGWGLGVQREIKEELSSGYSIIINSKINNVNDFFACIFPNLIVVPLVIWTFVFSPLSWLFWGQFDDIVQKTQVDGTDLFFISTEIPTSRKQIFWRKITFLTISLVSLYLLTFSLPLSLLLWKANYFSNFTGLQTFLFLAWNFLITLLSPVWGVEFWSDLFIYLWTLFY